MLEITTRQQCAEVPELLLLMVLQHDLITNTYRQVQSFFKNLQNVQKLNLLLLHPCIKLLPRISSYAQYQFVGSMAQR